MPITEMLEHARKNKLDPKEFINNPETKKI